MRRADWYLARAFQKINVRGGMVINSEFITYKLRVHAAVVDRNQEPDIEFACKRNHVGMLDPELQVAGIFQKKLATFKSFEKFKINTTCR
jgi:hypothetical protein